VHTHGSCAKSTLSQAAKSDGFVLSILKPIGRFFSWLGSAIYNLLCCKGTTFTKKSPFPKLPDDVLKSPFPKLPDGVLAAMVQKREEFDERDAIEIICGWGVGIGADGSYSAGGKFKEDLQAQGITYDKFYDLYATEFLCEGRDLRAKAGIHEEISDYLDLKVQVGTVIEIMQFRIKEIDDATLTKPLSDVLVRVQSEGLTEEVEAALRAAEKAVCLNQFRQYMQTVAN